MGSLPSIESFSLPTVENLSLPLVGSFSLPPAESFFPPVESCSSPAWLRCWPRLAVEESGREERRRLTTRTRALTTKTGTLTTIMVTETGRN